MARLANSVLFTPTAGGTTDFTVSAAVTGFMTPALAGAPTGVYKYRAESTDLSQWEIGEGTYTSGTTILTRTTVLYNSAGTGTGAGQSGAGTKINFTVAPQVGIVQAVEDTLGIDQANSWSAAQRTQARSNLDVPLTGVSGSAAGLNVNTITEAGFYTVDNTSTNTPFADYWYIHHQTYTGAGYAMQTAHCINTTGGQAVSYKRTQVGSVWGAWVQDVATIGQSLTATQRAQARANIGSLKANYIQNGAMMISQQNGATAGTATGYYPVDQFFISYSNAGVVTSQQVSYAVTAGGSPNRLRATATTADASVAAGDYAYIGHMIEGVYASELLWGTAFAKTVTIQFGVKAPAGTYCVTVANSAGNRSYVAEYTIAAGEANTDVIKSVTIPGDTSGTWLKDTGIGVIIRFGLMCGSTYQQAAGSWGTLNPLGSSNQFNFMGTINNIFELFDVGLYEGSAAPPFQMPDFQVELMKCQRYWQKLDWHVYIGAASATGMYVINVLTHLTSMRVTPTGTFATSSNTSFTTVAGGPQSPNSTWAWASTTATGYCEAAGTVALTARL